ncbi:hypothetical protein BN1723_006636 [Verticillium longisporum]|uniref:FAD-binding FR-type domain-containing protein n=1 Tax=Verticillium longisporum TaxID=100787 RepID=A0A0G4NGJ3_VERLO|nr:hypothetical protein BN1723_006636 [Verticillium longisporum]
MYLRFHLLSPYIPRMATPTHPTTSHEERTAEEPRDAEIHSVIVDDITEINLSVRLFRLKTVNGLPLTFLPGQWLDTFVPGIPEAGGFTITSPPHLAHSPVPYVELAIQRSPTNAPAAWLFQPTAQVLRRTLQVRVGGAFVWPPPRMELARVQNILFVAGGVGINPLMSIVSHLTSGQNPPPFTVEFMYATKIPSEAWDNGSLRLDNILFMTRLLKLFSEGSITESRAIKSKILRCTLQENGS